MKERSSANTYTLYETHDGGATWQWQFHGRPRVPGCFDSEHGDWFAPAFRYVVRAGSARQAVSMVHLSQTSLSRDDGLGVWWDRHTTDDPPPLGEDQTIHYALIALCRAPTMTLWVSREDAERRKANIDEAGCGGGCYGGHFGFHEIVPMTLDEAKKRSPCFTWWTGPHGHSGE